MACGALSWRVGPVYPGAHGVWGPMACGARVPRGPRVNECPGLDTGREATVLFIRRGMLLCGLMKYHGQHAFMGPWAPHVHGG